MDDSSNVVSLSRFIPLNGGRRHRIAGAARILPSAPKPPLEATLDVLDGRFKTLIVWHLFWGARPFCELMRTVVGITKKTLRQDLADMERHGLVRREVRRGSNRRAEYALTPLGETLKPIVAAMYEWGLKLQSALPRGSTSSNGAGASLG